MSFEPEQKSKIKKGGKMYLQYTGIAFQLAGLLFAAIYFGQKADAYLELSKPYITALFTLLAMVGFMYKLYVDLMKTPK